MQVYFKNSCNSFIVIYVHNNGGLQQVASLQLAQQLTAVVNLVVCFFKGQTGSINPRTTQVDRTFIYIQWFISARKTNMLYLCNSHFGENIKVTTNLNIYIHIHTHMYNFPIILVWACSQFPQVANLDFFLLYPRQTGIYLCFTIGYKGLFKRHKKTFYGKTIYQQNLRKPFLV